MTLSLHRLFLLAARSCGLGTDLPGISAVVIHDSDWEPRLDLQANRVFCNEHRH